MARRPFDTGTMDLFTWQPPQPPEPAAQFGEDEVRGASWDAKICRAMSLALDECGLTREEVAERMSACIGRTVSKAMLDAYTSEARDNHTISITRFLALVHATGDFRLLGLLEGLFDRSSIENRHVGLIRAAQRREAAAKLLKEAEMEEHRARTGR